jgi:hypothetical protein
VRSRIERGAEVAAEAAGDLDAPQTQATTKQGRVITRPYSVAAMAGASLHRKLDFFVGSAHRAAGVDDADADGDHGDRPERVGLDRAELGDDDQPGENGAYDPCPDRPAQEGERRADHDYAQDQVDPAPGREVQPDNVLIGDDVHLVVEQRNQPIDRAHRAQDRHHDPREEDEAVDSHVTPFISRLTSTVCAYSRYLMHLGQLPTEPIVNTGPARRSVVRRWDQRDGGVAAADDCLGDAAEEEALDAGAAVCTHHDEAGALGFGRFKDGLGGGSHQDEGLRSQALRAQLVGGAPHEGVGRRFDLV